MSNDWRNHWRKSRWVTIADFPLLSLDINPATYEGGHADAGCRGNDLLKQAFASDDERVGIKLRMWTQPGNPQHKARHLVRMSCRPGEYRPDDMDREIFMRDAIAFAVDEGWEVPGWLRSLIVDTPSSVVTPTTSNQSAGEQEGQEDTGYLPAPTASRVLTEQPVRTEAELMPSGELIPGKLPRVASGRLAVKAAWEIELEGGRAATAPEVMKLLQSWADEGKEPEYLIRSDRKERCVFWRTESGLEKKYGEEACGKTIRIWMDSRP